MTHYKAHVRRWNGEKFQKIEVGVSVGNQDYEGNKLEAIITYLNSISPSEITIQVCDTLQRWNDPTYDEVKALKNGDEWIKRNTPILKRLISPWKIIRWDKWLKSSNFENAIQQVTKLYDENQEFRNAVLTTAAEVAIRFQKQKRLSKFSSEISKEIFKQNSVKYLLEENAVLMLLWTSDREQLDLFYPSKITDALATGHKLLVDNYPEKKCQFNWREIRFTKIAENDNNAGIIMISKQKEKSSNNDCRSLASSSPTSFFAYSNPKLNDGEELIKNLPHFKKNLKTIQQLLAIKDEANTNPKLTYLRKQVISSDILSDLQIIYDLLLNETEFNNKTPFVVFQNIK